MTALDLFTGLAMHLPEAVDRYFPGYQGCILATRIACAVGNYFGVAVRPMPVRLVLYNAAFAAHIERGDKLDVERWHAEDGAHSVGIGFGASRPNAWDGHLIAVSDDVFGDFSIGQAERLDHGIVTGTALVGPYDGRRMWKAVNARGTVVEYQETNDWTYLAAPDWTDAKRRRAIVGPLIRNLKKHFTHDPLRR